MIRLSLGLGVANPTVRKLVVHKLCGLDIALKLKQIVSRFNASGNLR